MPLLARALIAWSLVSVVVGPLVGTLLATGNPTMRPRPARAVPATIPVPVPT